MKRLLILLVLLPILSSANTVTLHWLHTSDVHAALFPGLTNVTAYADSLRQRYGDGLVVSDGGDVLQGSPYAYYYNYVDTASTHIIARAMNAIGYDVCALGNHDIETGHAVYDRFMRQMDAPFVGANIIDTSTGKPYVRPYIILKKKGLRIAVLGLMTPAIPSWLPETLWRGLRFDDMEVTARHWMKVIREREKPDLVVGLFHSGWEGGIVTPDYTENATRLVAQRVPGFDLILYGHDHRALISREGQTLCLGPSSQATSVGLITIEVTKQRGRVVRKRLTASLTGSAGLIPATASSVHPRAVAGIIPALPVREAASTVDAWVNRPIGLLTDTLRERDAYFGPSLFIDLIHQLQLSLTGADISFAAPISFNAVIPAGTLRVADMFKLYRYENFLYTMLLTGREVRGFLEMSYDLWTNQMTSPDDHALLLDTILDNGRRQGLKNLSYNMDAAAGIRYDVDLTKPAGQRVKIYPPFDENKTYRVAVNSYRGNGGGELLTRGAGIPHDSLASRILASTDKDLRYYLMQRIEQLGTIHPEIISQWRFTPTEWTTEALRRDRKILFPK